MQQHTGQHLLTAVAHDHFGWATTAFHLGPELCDIELDAPQITRQQRHELEEAVINEIIAARNIRTSWVTQENYKTLNVRSRGLPDGHQGDVRLVEIQGLDVNTCGGTHLASTSELECLKLLDTETIRSGTRLFFIFGKRLRDRMEAHEQRGYQLRTILGRPDNALVAAIEQRLAHEKDLERSLRHAEDELAALYAKFLIMEPETLLTHHFENKDAGFLQKIVRLLLELDNNRAVFVTAEKDGSAFFSLAAGSACEADIPKLGREATAVLNGKGGGSGRQFQGKFGNLSKLHEAIAVLRASVT
jgi:alanyl-tRNA synthetase